MGRRIEDDYEERRARERGDEDDEDGDDDDVPAIEGDVRAKKQLLPWLEGLVGKAAETDEAEFDCALYQTYRGEDKLVAKLKPYEVGADTPGDYLEEMLDEAIDDAVQYPGSTRYSFHVKVNDKTKKQNFTLTNLHKARGDGKRRLTDEIADERTLSGHMGQMMRQNETLVDKALGVGGRMAEFLEREVERLSKENQELRAEQRAAIPLLHEVHSVAFQKELEFEKLKDERAQKKMVAGMLMQAIPQLAAGVMGGGMPAPPGFAESQAAPNGFPPQPSPDGGSSSPGAPATPPPELVVMARMAMQVEGLLASLEANPEKLQRLSEIVEPLDVATIFELRRCVQQLREIRDARNQSQATSSSPGGPAPAYAPSSSPRGSGANGHGASFVPLSSKGA